MRKSTSVNKNGTTAGETTTGLGWFPGYAIDLESGARLYMAFGENSFLVSENEKDGIDRVVAVYPDGNAFQWRQLNSKFLD